MAFVQHFKFLFVANLSQVPVQSVSNLIAKGSGYERSHVAGDVERHQVWCGFLFSVGMFEKNGNLLKGLMYCGPAVKTKMDSTVEVEYGQDICTVTILHESDPRYNIGGNDVFRAGKAPYYVLRGHRVVEASKFVATRDASLLDTASAELSRMGLVHGDGRIHLKGTVALHMGPVFNFV